MPGKEHTEEAVVAVLQQVESGAKGADGRRHLGISEGTF